MRDEYVCSVAIANAQTVSHAAYIKYRRGFNFVAMLSDRVQPAAGVEAWGRADRGLSPNCTSGKVICYDCYIL